MTNPMKPPAPFKPPITPEVLDRIDARIGTILRVEDLPGSDRLVQLQVDFGDRTSTVVVGMKQERANPAEICGRQALFIVNLGPKRLRGVVSEAMLFDVGYQDGLVPALLHPERAVPNGTRAG
jgi:methionine--tRNA ligase beta chain